MFLSAESSRLHRSSRVLSLLLPLPVVGCSASRMLSKQEVGRLITARSELTFSERGDLEIRVDCCACFGVIVVPVGFSLEIAARVVISMVEKYWYGLTCKFGASRSMQRKALRCRWRSCSLAASSWEYLGTRVRQLGLLSVVVLLF